MKNNMIALEALLDQFGEALLLEQYAPRYRYRVPKGDKSVGYFFSLMETLKGKLGVDEYIASQTTLEQIFNGFARLEGAKVNQRIFKKSPTGKSAENDYNLSEHYIDDRDLNRPPNSTKALATAMNPPQTNVYDNEDIEDEEEDDEEDESNH